MQDLFALGELEASKEEIVNWLRKEDHEDFVALTDRQLACFLNGWIIKNRGKKEGKSPVPELVLDNNQRLRKIKIALTLQQDDMLHIFKKSGRNVSKSELTSFFRNSFHHNYMPCKDQYFRAFVQGLQKVYRPVH